MCADKIGKGGQNVVEPVRRKRARRRRPRRDEAPTRRKAFWGVYDSQLRRVAVFEYAKRDEAEATAEEMTESQKTSYFVSLVKEAME
jgi:hypothetical protein